MDLICARRKRRRRASPPETSDSEWSDVESSRALNRLEWESRLRFQDVQKLSVPVEGCRLKVVQLSGAAGASIFYVDQLLLENSSVVLKDTLAQLGTENDCNDRGEPLLRLKISDIGLKLFVRFVYGCSVEMGMQEQDASLLWELALLGKKYEILELQKECFGILSYWAARRGMADTGLIPTLPCLGRQGFELSELIALGCKRVLLLRMKATLSEFLQICFTVELTPRLAAKHILTRKCSHLADVSPINANLSELMRKGWEWADLILTGFHPRRFNDFFTRPSPRSCLKILLEDAKLSPDDACMRLIYHQYSVGQLRHDGIDSSFFRACIRSSHRALFEAGYSRSDLSDLGYVFSDVRPIVKRARRLGN